MWNQEKDENETEMTNNVSKKANFEIIIDKEGIGRCEAN